MKTNFKKVFGLGFLSLFLVACATYYQKSFDFQQYFANGQLGKAQSFLEKNEKEAEKRNRLLYFLDRGVIEQMLGNYEQSNAYFEQAYIFSQDFRKNFSQDLIGMTANPMLTTYRGEDYEVVLLHFYKAMNFMQLNQLDNALIEIRRVNVQLNEMNDRYEYKKNRYKEDAFAHTLMGLIYEAKGDNNNAFIAYRNAYNVYKTDYKENFLMQTPKQLKLDILRTAQKISFNQELDFYEREFDTKFQAQKFDGGEVVFFWLNGLGPVKSEFSINLSVVNGQGGLVSFANEQEQISIPYSSNRPYYNSEPSQFSDLKFVRMAVPKFKVRKPLINNARIEANGKTYPFEMVENIEQIAIATLKDRMWREMAKSIGRLAIKQAAEAAAKEKNDNLGAAVSMLGAFSEKADTRNWQTLPHSIHYTRIKLDTGLQNINLITEMNDTISYQINIVRNQTHFQTFHTLASTPPLEQ